MKTTVIFFKLNNSWFADVADHTLAENHMVAGAGTFLVKANGILGNNEDNSSLARLNMRSHNQWGATYALTGTMAEKYDAVGFELWICNVTHKVLGEHPRSIYIHEIH